MAQKGIWNLSRENGLQDRAATSRLEDDVIRESMRCMKSSSYAAG